MCKARQRAKKRKKRSYTYNKCYQKFNVSSHWCHQTSYRWQMWMSVPKNESATLNEVIQIRSVYWILLSYCWKQSSHVFGFKRNECAICVAQLINIIIFRWEKIIWFSNRVKYWTQLGKNVTKQHTASDWNDK